ncbi:MAG: hypothetical protein ACLGQX_01625 [Acidobacteriota bacterium]
MRFLEAVAIAFYRTFGITQPSQQRLRRAVWFLMGILVLILAAFAAAGIVIFHSM